MGTYTEFEVNGYQLLTTKSAVVPEIMTVFQESDRQEFSRPIDASDAEDVRTVVRYESTASRIIDRLEVMGFTLARARAEFDAERRSEIERWEDEEHDWRPDNLPLLKRMTFRSYQRALGRVMTAKLYGYSDEPVTRDPVSRYILDDHDELVLGWFGNDIRLLIRTACEVVPGGAPVAQDITDLIAAGYYTASERVCEQATIGLLSQHPENSSRIILTEGTNDAHVLKAGLELLYPHLANYFSFLDFDAIRAPGGASQLVSVIKAFAGAGITNRTIALFDNDTAAGDALRALDRTALPKNIRALHYPDIPLLNRYPTIGPSGLMRLNVNGLAGSIELYFGKDILQSGNGLMPVQWRGYSEAMKQYHGEVTQKASLLKAFNERTARCRNDQAVIGKTDWSGIDAILQTIFHAFDSPSAETRQRTSKR